MRRIISLILSIVFLLCVLPSASLAEVETQTDFAPSGTLTIWSFNDELSNITKYYTEKYPDVTIKYVMIPVSLYPDELRVTLQTGGTNAPDVVALDASFVKGFIDSDQGFLADLSSLKPAIQAAGTLPYVIDVGTDEQGILRGASWQASPVAMFYRRSLAKKYLGTDDPVKMQLMSETFYKYKALARTLEIKSKGTVDIISSTDDLYLPFKAARTTGWVKNGKFVIDQKITDYFVTAKEFKNKGYSSNQALWSPGWFAGMNGSYKDAKGKPKEVFSYFLPLWGMNYVLKTNALNINTGKSTSGDWAMCTGPSANYWGGTWVSAYSKTPNLDLAKHFIQWVTTDQTFLSQYAKDTGDFLSSVTVADKIKWTYKEPFLNGQNQYSHFSLAAKWIKAATVTQYDQHIEVLMNKQLVEYVNGRKTLAQAMWAFRAGVNQEVNGVVSK